MEAESHLLGEACAEHAHTVRASRGSSERGPIQREQICFGTRARIGLVTSVLQRKLRKTRKRCSIYSNRLEPARQTHLGSQTF